ncbi:MAG: extracellular solute-binding protein [Desulfurococcales archaeon]|jgi:multiple sugar transport system substrate-binding protein|nr:extracellular solute-binding protein [Desulfurococcales archaeon]
MIKGLSRTILAGIIIAIIAIGIATYLFVTTMGIGQPGGKPMLVIWGRATFVPPQLYWVEQKVRKWASEKGVDVEITWISVAEIGRKLLAAVEAGSPPYVVINGHPVAVFAEKGLLVPLDDIVDKLGRDDIYEIKLRTS